VEDWAEVYRALVFALPSGQAGGQSCYVHLIKTPLGEMLMICDDRQLHLLEFCDRDLLPAQVKKIQKITGASCYFSANRCCLQVEGALERYFSGESASFSIPCALHGTQFNLAVWQALQHIPPGQSWSYARQAAFVGRPKAYRAVAQANSRNQIAIIIPCHRVIGSDGRLTGYAGGLNRKEWLLAHEQRYFAV